MKDECSVIRDLLPLYADDVCSDVSRTLVREHLEECPECAAVLKQLQESEIEKDLKDERDEVIRYQAKKFKTRSAALGTTVSGIFAIPVLVCLIINLASGAALNWFFIVLASLAVAGSLIIVPLMAPENKLFWTFCCFTASLMILLAVCAILGGGLFGGGAWFFPASSSVLFGLALVFLPFLIRAKPLQPLIGTCSKPLLVISADVILFANMMNMVTLTGKNVISTILIALCCGAGIYLMVEMMNAKRREGK